MLETYCVCAKNPDNVGKVRALAEESGFTYAKDDPDFVISLGGDGTFLISERQYPGIPKLPVRDSLICFKCHNEPLEQALQMIRAGEAIIEQTLKLQARVSDARRLATNDVIIRNVNPRHALRFSLRVDGELVDDMLIGDGIVVATPFGATGYYRSITGDTFAAGIGVAFNNLTEQRAPLELDESATVELEVVRSRAHLAVDNDPDMAVLEVGDAASVSRAPEVTRLIGHE
ncbi:MAG: hypothetical protein R6V05_13060 [Candidatus Brocadiia bacterium]